MTQGEMADIIERTGGSQRPLNAYELVRCPTCGHPWSDHTGECSQDIYKEYYMRYDRTNGNIVPERDRQVIEVNK